MYTRTCCKTFFALKNFRTTKCPLYVNVFQCDYIYQRNVTMSTYVVLHKVQVILIAKDFGAFPAYLFTLLHPTRVSGVISVGIVFTPPGPRTFLKQLPEGFYINRWQVYIYSIVFFWVCSLFCLQSRPPSSL